MRKHASPRQQWKEDARTVSCIVTTALWHPKENNRLGHEQDSKISNEVYHCIIKVSENHYYCKMYHIFTLDLCLPCKEGFVMVLILRFGRPVGGIRAFMYLYQILMNCPCVNIKEDTEIIPAW
jgi:hypothetical protein